MASSRTDKRGARNVRQPGRAALVQVPAVRRGTSVQVCGLNPWNVGSGSPIIGVPIGRRLRTNGSGVAVCADPISWFHHAKLLSNPSQFILGLPGEGKSSLCKRQITGLAAFGIPTLVLGDLKPDYVQLVTALGGQVIKLGSGMGFLNPLDISSAYRGAAKLPADSPIAARMLTEARRRRQITMEMLVSVQRGHPAKDYETSLLHEAMLILDTAFEFSPEKAPLIKDLRDLIAAAPAKLRETVLDRGEITEYHRLTTELEHTLIALSQPNGLGEVFSQHTSVQMDLTGSVVIDVSAIAESDEQLRAAVLGATWAAGFGEVAVHHALADAGIAPKRTFHVVLDELWQMLQAGSGLVGKVDALLRLNRTKGVGVTMISHTMDDLKALPNEEDRRKAAGLVERAGMVVLFGLPPSEMPRVETAVRLTEVEKDMITGWSTPPAWSSSGRSVPPGRGHALIKVGGRPGIPVLVELTEEELDPYNTNQRW
jgi:hypothetical protein